MFKTIVVGDDGSRYGECATAQASSLARENGARLVLVHVTEIIGGKGGSYPVAVDEPDIRARLRQRVAELVNDGIDATYVQCTVQLGGPAHEIVAVARAEDADLVVVGSRGHSVVSSLVLGSVPLRLLHIAPCPVLVVPPPDRD